MLKRLLLFFGLILLTDTCFSQSLIDTAHSNILPATWNDERLINSPTTKTVAPGFMEVYFMHRLGSMGTASNGGFHTLYGFDVASDVLFGFDFGITKRFMLGFSRSKDQELIDIYGKYRLLDQKRGGSPISIAVNEDMGITPEDTTNLYSGSSEAESRRSIADRFSYLSQVIIASRITKSLSCGDCTYTLVTENHIIETINTNNNTYDENAIPALGIAGQVYV